MNEANKPKQTFRIGFSRSNISCIPGHPLAGYAGCRACSENHDPLLIQCMVLLDDEDHCAVYVSLDLLAVDDFIMNRVKRMLEEADFFYDVLIFQAIHTHCAPAGLLQTDRGFLKAAQYFAGKPNTTLMLNLCNLIVLTILDAKWNAIPARFYKASGKVENFASNRVEGKVIESPVFVIEAENRQRKACFVFAANHPTVLGADTTESSADYVYGLRKQLEEAGYSDVFFLNGPCGDLSCRYTRRSSDFEEAQRLGRLLGEGALKALESKEPFSPCLADLTTLDIFLPACEIPGMEEAETALKEAVGNYEKAKAEGADALRLRELHVEIETAQVMVQKANISLPSDEIPIQSLVWNWDGETFVTYPGELFSTLPFLQDTHVHVLCYCNGYNLYLADESAYENQVYEALCSPFSRKAAEVYNEAISLCLKNR